MDTKKRIGLSLSGGGYRATIYHLGTLKKLQDMKILDKIDIISTISGGAITGALYGLNNGDFNHFENQVRSAVKKNIITGILISSRFLFAAIPILLILALILLSELEKGYSFIAFFILILLILKFQFRLFPISKIINKLYSKYFFKDCKLPALREFPIILINTTNYDTGRPFTFSKNRMGDSGYDYKDDVRQEKMFNHQEFPVSLAVASSTCVPFAFTPIYINKQYFANTQNSKSIKPCLVDGGVYDNQGLHKLTQRNSAYSSDIIIVSDAAAGSSKKKEMNNTVKLLIGTGDAFMNRIKNFQMVRNVYENKKYLKRPIAYQSLAWDFDNCFKSFMNNLKKGLILDEVIECHGISQLVIDENWKEIEQYMKERINYEKMKADKPTNDELVIARSVSTNLWSLKDKQIDALMKQASVLTELQIKLYCPSIVDGGYFR
ncbi:patatin-like phospholipase family protein [Chryseobacterium sp. RLHN22]|uniref:patatin-like phospholipase family protein n=1 Tax=Chryseobacterium sp. RLHN22 TaxID=3437885 RepID=UPI003D9B3D61